eukprot:4681648-Pyramimonas_sp.AAC.1
MRVSRSIRSLANSWPARLGPILVAKLQSTAPCAFRPRLDGTRSWSSSRPLLRCVSLSLSLVSGPCHVQC